MAVDLDDFRLDFAVRVYVQVAHRHIEVEAPRTAGTGIEIEHSPVAADAGYVRVPVEDRGKLRSRRVQVQRADVVQQVEVSALDEQDFRFGQAGARSFPVDVAAHRGDGRDPAQGLEDFGVAHIAEVKNALHAGQERRNLRAKQAVRVADDADLQFRFSPGQWCMPFPQISGRLQTATVNETIRDMLTLSIRSPVPAGHFSRIASNDPSFKKLNRARGSDKVPEY